MLSLGEQQRLAFGRLLVNRPRCGGARRVVAARARACARSPAGDPQKAHRRPISAGGRLPAACFADPCVNTWSRSFGTHGRGMGQSRSPRARASAPLSAARGRRLAYCGWVGGSPPTSPRIRGERVAVAWRRSCVCARGEYRLGGMESARRVVEGGEEWGLLRRVRGICCAVRAAATRRQAGDPGRGELRAGPYQRARHVPAPAGGAPPRPRRQGGGGDVSGRVGPVPPRGGGRAAVWLRLAPSRFEARSWRDGGGPEASSWNAAECGRAGRCRAGRAGGGLSPGAAAAPTRGVTRPARPRSRRCPG